jgi:hypothetical protein
MHSEMGARTSSAVGNRAAETPCGTRSRVPFHRRIDLVNVEALSHLDAEVALR